MSQVDISAERPKRKQTVLSRLASKFGSSNTVSSSDSKKQPRSNHDIKDISTNSSTSALNPMHNYMSQPLLKQNPKDIETTRSIDQIATTSTPFISTKSIDNGIPQSGTLEELRKIPPRKSNLNSVQTNSVEPNEGTETKKVIKKPKKQKSQQSNESVVSDGDAGEQAGEVNATEKKKKKKKEDNLAEEAAGTEVAGESSTEKKKVKPTTRKDSSSAENSSLKKNLIKELSPGPILSDGNDASASDPIEDEAKLQKKPKPKKVAIPIDINSLNDFEAKIYQQKSTEQELNEETTQPKKKDQRRRAMTSHIMQPKLIQETSSANSKLLNTSIPSVPRPPMIVGISGSKSQEFSQSQELLAKMRDAVLPLVKEEVSKKGEIGRVKTITGNIRIAAGLESNRRVQNDRVGPIASTSDSFSNSGTIGKRPAKPLISNLLNKNIARRPTVGAMNNPTSIGGFNKMQGVGSTQGEMSTAVSAFAISSIHIEQDEEVHSKEEVEEVGVVDELNIHMVKCFEDGLVTLPLGWDTKVYADSKYNMWRRAVFDTLPIQRDFPLLIPEDLMAILSDPTFIEKNK